MSKLTIDAELRTKLNGLNQSIEFCEESGQVVGRFLPEEEYQKLLYAALEIPLPPEEIERRRKEKGGRPLAEFWRELGVK
jgi:hypothetical protein